MAPIATTTDLANADTSTGAGAAGSIPGRWAGLAILEIEMERGTSSYYTLLRITTYLLIALISKEILSLPVV